MPKPRPIGEIQVEYGNTCAKIGELNYIAASLEQKAAETRNQAKALYPRLEELKAEHNEASAEEASASSAQIEPATSPEAFDADKSIVDTIPTT